MHFFLDIGNTGTRRHFVAFDGNTRWPLLVGFTSAVIVA